MSKKTDSAGIKFLNGLAKAFEILFIILLPFCAGDVLKMFGIGKK